MQKYPFIFSNEWQYRFRRHATFWFFWWAFQGFLYAFASANSPAAYANRLPLSLIESFFYLFNHIFLAYSLIYFVIPRFLLKQRYWQTAIWTLFLFFITACISTLILFLIVSPLREAIPGKQAILSAKPVSVNIFLSLLAGLRGGITVGGIAAAIKLMKYWYLKEQRNLHLQKENAEAQLQLLMGQVHPHFLFNTLNNIYSHTQNSSPVAAKMVSGLSDLLRFILYESKQSRVPLEKELKMMRDYIHLERIRYDQKLELHLDFPDNTEGLEIAPLLLLPLVENAFKHGTSNMLDHPWVSLKLSVEGSQFRMKLINGKTSAAPEITSGKGIGISNVRKRLELIYPGKHELIISSEAEVFIVNLVIKLERKAQSAAEEPEKIAAYA